MTYDTTWAYRGQISQNVDQNTPVAYYGDGNLASNVVPGFAPP